MTDVSLALSGGGAAGLGHIPILEALDDLGIRPVAIAGTSMGSLIGACYAAGMTGADIRDHVIGLADDPMSVVKSFWSNAKPTLQSFTVQIEADAAVRSVLPERVPETFEDLDMPLTVVATDFYARERACFASGDIRDALSASIAIPAVFQPVRLGGRILVDGGVADNLPVRELPKNGLCIASDAAIEPPSTDTEMPGLAAQVTGSMRIMMRTMMSEGLKQHPNVLFLQPASRRFGALDFDKVEEILASVDDLRDLARAMIAERLGAS